MTCVLFIVYILILSFRNEAKISRSKFFDMEIIQCLKTVPAATDFPSASLSCLCASKISSATCNQKWVNSWIKTLKIIPAKIKGATGLCKFSLRSLRTGTRIEHVIQQKCKLPSHPPIPDFCYKLIPQFF